MSKVIIRNLDNKEVIITSPDKSLLHNLQEAYLDWMHACGGKGRCTTCKAIIVKGLENMSPLSKAEIKYTHLGKLQPGQRLICQSYITGDVILEIPDECKLPHIKYSY